MKKYLILILIIILIISCDFPEHYWTAEPACITTTSDSDNIDDLTPSNQLLLIEKIRNQKPTDYRYFFKTFMEEANNTYLIVNFRNDTACFDIKMLVDRWDKLGGMKRTNGVSYPHELYDLQWGIESKDGKEVVVYQDMHKIID